MSIWGKLIGGAAGFAIGGPIGLMVGVAAGHIADNVGSGGRSRRRRLPRSAKSKQQIFAIALIVLAAKMAKADGQVTRDEVDAFKRLFKVPQEDMKAVGRILTNLPAMPMASSPTPNRSLRFLLSIRTCWRSFLAP